MKMLESCNMEIKGLTAAEVDAKIAANKVNRFKDNSQRSILTILLSNLIDLPNIIIFIAVMFLLLYGQGQDAIMISGVIILNNLISIVQELQARRSLQRITVINRVPVKVIRAGKVQEIFPEDIVEGEYLQISSGSNLFVDGKLLNSNSLLIDESILTGESDYLKKEAGEEVFSGSYVVAGQGVYIAEKVGSDSFVNKITASARKYINYLSPLQVQINSLVKTLTILAVITIVLLFSINYLFINMSEVQLLKAVVSIVTSTVPQGIVLTLTLAFMLGVIRMYRQKILIQKASAVETLAGVKVLCMDKTGTLTQNKLVVQELLDLTPGRQFATQTSRQLLEYFIKHTIEKNKTIIAIGNYLPGHSSEGQASSDQLTETSELIELIEQVPFTSRSKFSGLEVKIADNYYRLMLGSPEVLARNLNQVQRTLVEQKEDAGADLGWRNLLFMIGEKRTNSKLSIGSAVEKDTWVAADIQPDSDLAQAEYNYYPAGFISLEDELRLGASEVISEFIATGVKPVIISGDGAKTLLAILKQLHITELNKVITGAQLASMSSLNKMEAILGHDVFARVSPEQKVEIVEVYQSAFGRVAMLGDGVNDALAIKQANLGIAMGSGASVTRNIADVVLLDDDLQRLLAVIVEGKEILFNTLRSAQLLLIRNYYALVVLITSLLLALPFPFSPRGLFLLSLFNGTLPIIAILGSRNSKLPNIQFLAELRRFVLIGGTLIAGLSVIILITQQDRPLLELQTILLGFLTLSGVVNSLIALNKSYNPIKMFFGSWLSLIAVFTVGMLLAAIYIAPLARFFELTALNQESATYMFAMSFIYMVSFSLISASKFAQIKTDQT